MIPAPWKHQVEALSFIKDKPGAMLAMEMGTGKSRVITDLIEHHKYRKVLIVAPLSIVGGVWPNQFKTHSDGSLSVAAIDQTITARKGLSAIERKIVTADQADVVIVNYETIWRPQFGDWVKQQRWDLLVLDESQKIKAPGGKASIWLSRLADHIPQRVGLTGTPMPHGPMDIYGQFRALDKSIFGTSFVRFRNRYALMGGYGQHQVVGYQREEELQEKLYSIAYRVTAADVLDLPEYTDITYTCEMPEKTRKIYNQLSSRFLVELENGQITAANALVKLLRLQQITSGYARDDNGLDHQLDSVKEQLLTDTLDSIGDEPIVVFCRFKHDLEAIYRVAANLERAHYEISGSKKELDGWRENGGILAVQIQSGGLGLDLTAARYAVYYSLGYSLGDYLQSRARVHRPGQSRNVRYVHLVSRSTIDEVVMAALKNKEDVVQRILERGLNDQ